jgi:zinc transporter 2
MALALLADMLTILSVIYFRPDLGIIDPICTFVFSVLVLATTIKILRDTVGVLMEATPAVRFSSFLFSLEVAYFSHRYRHRHITQLPVQ